MCLRTVAEIVRANLVQLLISFTVPRTDPTRVIRKIFGFTIVLKIGEMITEAKKVRCTGCAIVLLVVPDDDNPDAVIATIPKKSGRLKGAAGAVSGLYDLAAAA